MSSFNTVPSPTMSVMDARVWYQLTSLDGVVTPITVVLEMYNALQTELSSVSEPVTMAQLIAVLRRPTELLTFVFDRQQLIASAHASLCFPGCRPTVWIEKVIVAKRYRGRGVGRYVMMETERLVRSRFHEALPLTIKLTSRHERGTAPFYTGLDFVGTSTERYEKIISESAP